MCVFASKYLMLKCWHSSKFTFHVSHGRLMASKLQSFDATWPEHSGPSIFFNKKRKKHQCWGCVITACVASLLLQCSIKAGFSGWSQSQNLVLIIWSGQEPFSYSPCANTTIWLSRVIVYPLPNALNHIQ